MKQSIVTLYSEKYFDANLTHYCELLEELEGIIVSISSVRTILRNKLIISPKANRSTRRTVKKELKVLQAQTVSTKKATAIQNAILSLEDAHPRRSRCPNFGELIQMDASEYLWFGDTKTHLHIAVDDATGAIVGAYFDAQETLNGYYHILHQILTNYGIPYRFLTDNRTVFDYKRKNETGVEHDNRTQFSYACKQLGIDISTSSVPQAKGRVERMNATLQSRLHMELLLNAVSSIEEANEFLNSYIKKFNKQFALPANSIKSVFEMQPNAEKINITLAVFAHRQIDNGCCLKFKNNYYSPVDKNGVTAHYRKGTKAMVIRAFDGELYANINEHIYVLDLLLEHKPVSKSFEIAADFPKPRKKYIPPLTHPWRQTSFKKHMDTQKHRVLV